MQRHQASHRAWHANGQATATVGIAHSGRPSVVGLGTCAIDLKHARMRGARRANVMVDREERRAGRNVGCETAVAAKPAVVRLDNEAHERCRDERVDGITAPSEHLRSRGCGRGMPSRDRSVFAGCRRARGLPAAGPRGTTSAALAGLRAPALLGRPGRAIASSHFNLSRHLCKYYSMSCDIRNQRTAWQVLRSRRPAASRLADLVMLSHCAATDETLPRPALSYSRIGSI